MLYIWRKLIFFCQHNFMKKAILSCLKMNLCICKKGWCVGLEQEGGFLRQGGENCLKYRKRRWNRKEGSGNKNFKRGGGKLG